MYIELHTYTIIHTRLFSTMADTSENVSADYQLTPFEWGQIKAHMHHGLGSCAITEIITKPNGTDHWRPNAIWEAMEKLRDPDFRGKRKVGSGRPRETDIKFDKKLKATVLKKRGEVKVTVPYLKKMIPEARKFSDTLIRERLWDFQLAKMRRRKKPIIPGQEFKDLRMEYARFILRRHDVTIREWARTDGITIYVDRTPAELASGRRLALGSWVWRFTDGHDAMYEECIGPSSYNKAQGHPVRVWGMLAKGTLNIYVFPQEYIMNRWNYAWLIENKFPKWLDGCDTIIQDYEACLRHPIPLEAMKDIGVSVLLQHTKYSQDLNSIENCWHLLRERLYSTMPVELETRDVFVVRLRNAVKWLNSNYRETLLGYCSDMKERARDVLEQKGGRTKW